jgi:hypothetical protein
MNMQPEDIIKQKDWQQLTEEEKKVVFPLAAGEQEYRLLKNLLKVAAEEPGDVPEINPVIHEKLSAGLRRKQKKKINVWYYAAASVVVALLAIAWLLTINKETGKKDMVIVPGKEQKKQDSAFVKVLPRDSTVIVEKRIVPQPKKSRIKRSASQQAAWASISTAIAKDEKMLALVTEVY